jgi:hypothetical protein
MNENRISILFPIIILSMSFFACQTTETLREPEDKTVNYRYQNIEFLPESIVDQITSNLEMTVTPVDATVLNQITLEAAFRAGDYERDIVDELFDKDSLDDLRSATRDRVENKIQVTEQILASINTGNTSAEMGRNLIERMWGDSNDGFDGSEIDLISDNRATPQFNPYHTGTGYSSVFELYFENYSNEIKIINIDKFQIASGNEILSPFDMEYFEQRLESEPVKMENAYRYNMTDRLTLAPSQSVVKYIAIPAINRNVESVVLQYLAPDLDNRMVQFVFELNPINEHHEVDMFNYFVNTETVDTNRPQRFTNHYIAIEFEDGNSFALKEDYFFIPKEYQNDIIKICATSIARQHGLFECDTRNLSEYQNRNIQFDISAES